MISKNSKGSGLAVVLLMMRLVMFAQPDVIDLNSGWLFAEAGQSKWYPAIVPGEVHTDLLRNKLIQDPFYRDNEKKLQWIGRKDWSYKKSFNITGSILRLKTVELVFDGLDTYATVFINNQEVLKADNMFRQWRIDVKKYLQQGRNELVILFRAAQEVADSFAKKDLPYVIPDNPRCYVRKAQYHFGWDWGPVFTTCGIWKGVRVEACNEKAEERPYHAARKIELVQQADSAGKSFFFRIDGEPVYMKGANYIPSDAFLSRVKKSDYEKVVSMARDANMNMLRVWGGGIYEDDYFYDLCDKYGINVWQDFMFAGTMVPGDTAFFSNVREEVKYQVKRLRHHPCIVLWCGNNEIDEAFFNWGWHNSFHISGQDSVRLWTDYKRLFQDSLPVWIREADPYRPYVSSSPMHGWGRTESYREGDSHYWGTWWGLAPIESVYEKTGRFVSEYGMQAMPNYSTIEAFTLPGDRYLFSPVLQAHQKAGNGFMKLNSYLHRYFIDSARIRKMDVRSYTYLTQCLQYFSLRNIIAIHRGKKPFNMGTLLWQLNDCWPVASWSITDYDNRSPKAAWYATKEAYRDDVIPLPDFTYPKDLTLEDPGITWKVNGNQISFHAEREAKYVYVSIRGYKGKFSDNYFDIPAGKEKTITYAGPLKKPQISIVSLYDVYSRY